MGIDDAHDTPGQLVVLGATGTIGRAVVRAVLAQGSVPVCPVRDPSAALPACAIAI